MIYFSGMLRRIAAKAPVMAGSTKRSDTDRHFSWKILGCVFFLRKKVEEKIQEMDEHDLLLAQDGTKNNPL